MISFGIEFEFDAIRRDGEIIRGCGDEPPFISDGWGWQSDHTTTYELRSPVFTSLHQCCEQINNQFSGWLAHVRDHIPYMCNSGGRSLGVHIHLGNLDRMLTYEERMEMAKKIIHFYPLLAAIHAQPIPSNRGLTTIYARSMANYRAFADVDHYAEISLSHHGTLEMRIFDSNVPQATLTCVWLSTVLANSDDPNVSTHRFNWEQYNRAREAALRYGIVALPLTEVLRKAKSMVGNIELPDVQSIKEVLYMMARFRLNLWGVWQYLRISPYQYMRACLADCAKYLESLITHVDSQRREKVQQWIEAASELENIDQLIGLSMGADERLIEAISQRVEQLVRERPELAERLADRAERAGLSRSEVREALERGNYMLLRLHEVPDMSQREVAEHVSTLLREHGNGFNRAMSAHEIVESPARFYVLHVHDRGRGRGQIVGAIAVRIRTGEISSLVVDRRFRRLGAGRILLNHALSVLRDNGQSEAYACVRNGNEASMRLFESLGFVASERHEKYVVYRRSLSGDE